ncbi:MAG TPA: hypothetical protein VMQ73_06660 [Methylomirabilota bacterium]|nr:hypothetical protein [Methylomirabilota bacterium]
MCLACQMEDELWFAYLEQVARQEKVSAAEAAQPETPDKPKPAPPSPFACEELPSE